MVIAIRVVQFWSEIILVISNRTRSKSRNDFRPNCTPLSSITIINHNLAKKKQKEKKTEKKTKMKIKGK